MFRKYILLCTLLGTLFHPLEATDRFEENIEKSAVVSSSFKGDEFPTISRQVHKPNLEFGTAYYNPYHSDKISLFDIPVISNDIVFNTCCHYGLPPKHLGQLFILTSDCLYLPFLYKEKKYKHAQCLANQKLLQNIIKGQAITFLRELQGRPVIVDIINENFYFKTETFYDIKKRLKRNKKSGIQNSKQYYIHKMKPLEYYILELRKKAIQDYKILKKKSAEKELVGVEKKHQENIAELEAHFKSESKKLEFRRSNENQLLNDTINHQFDKLNQDEIQSEEFEENLTSDKSKNYKDYLHNTRYPIFHGEKTI